MKLFLLLMAVIAVMTILQFPAWQDVSNEKYEIDKKEYPKLVEKWEKQYPEEKEQEENKNSKPVKPTEPNIQVFLIQSLNGILMLAMVSFLGINIQRRTDLNVPILDGVIEGNFDMSRLGDLGLNSLIYSIASIVPMIVMILITRAVVVPGEFSTAAIASWKLCLLMIYTAFNLQLTLLFLLMSTMVWLFHKYRNKLKLEPHWAAIVVTVVLSGFYVLPFNIAPGVKLIYSIASSLLISFSLVGILGYLYWKKGLEYSLVAGIISYGVMPLLASVII
ncbi:MAG: hypothetical protein JW738_04850 [Actinobacteria bacterium]|nr:hypothetical protein [Actinomycetota bacterium]